MRALGTEPRTLSQPTVAVKTTEHDSVQTRRRRVRAFVNLPPKVPSFIREPNSSMVMF